MPQASHSVQVKAPVDIIWRLLLTAIEAPGRFLPGVAGLEVKERQPGFLVRRLTLGEVTVTERVTAFEKRHEVDYLLVEPSPYAGQCVHRIEPPLRPGLSAGLTLSLDWRRKDGGQDSLDLEAALAEAAARIKAAAETG